MRVTCSLSPVVLVLFAGSCHALGASPFPASVDLSSLNGTDGFVINGISANSLTGFSVSGAGDVNADGVDDVIIGVLDSGTPGDCYVVFGGPGVGAGGSLELSALNGANGFVINKVSSGLSVVCSAGDVNGDDVDDLIIGAPRASPNGQSLAGESYVVFGGPGVGAGGSLDLATLDGTNGFVIHGIDAFGESGMSLSSAGDVNGDDMDDLIIGAPYAGENGNYAGETYVVFGGAGVGAGGTLELSALDGTNGFVVNGLGSSDYSGKSVSSAGDVNGDGMDDLIIGAPYAGQSAAGESYVVFGGMGLGASGSLDLSSLDGTNGFVVSGVDVSDNSGWSVSCAGDVNGDGAGDLIIGATRADPNGQSGAGESYVVFGGAGVGAGGSLDLSSLDGTNGFDLSGWSVSGAGDLNADSFADLIIGAPFADLGATQSTGESYVVFGGASVGAGGSLDLSALSGADGFLMEGFGVADQCGRSVSSAGDVNADGVDDVIIGALNADPPGRSNAGQSYIVFGRGTSACCFGATFCVDGLAPSQCANFGGTFFDGTTCASTICPGCVGDLDGDGATNVLDFSIFASNFACDSGP